MSILSHVHSTISRELDEYSEAYCKLKAMRTLEWKLNLGQVQVLVILALAHTLIGMLTT